MFTGIIEEIGTVEKISPLSGGRKLFINSAKIVQDIKVNDSIAVNGVCLTAVKVDENGFWVDAVGETMRKTTFSSVTAGTKVNLERAMRIGARLDGHIVQGHVNGVGKLLKINRHGDSYLIDFSAPDNLLKYMIAEGSICVNGISLTIARLNGAVFTISVIPHTWENTTFKYLKSGAGVNLEADVIAKYVEKLLTYNKSELSVERLKEEGF